MNGGVTARTGCDVQRVDDVSVAVRHFGQRYLDRVYTLAEQDSLRTGGPASLAARFAAKEAVLKLIGHPDGVDLRCIEIATAQGRPAVRLHGRAAELAAIERLDGIDVSLSHTGDVAFAVAVALVHPSDTPTPRGTAHA